MVVVDSYFAAPDENIFKQNEKNLKFRSIIFFFLKKVFTNNNNNNNKYYLTLHSKKVLCNIQWGKKSDIS